jgi:hypothetical protein
MHTTAQQKTRRRERRDDIEKEKSDELGNLSIAVHVQYRLRRLDALPCLQIGRTIAASDLK